MGLLWKLWLWDGLLALLLLGWLTVSAYEFRTKPRRRWLSASLFVFAYSLGVIGAVANEDMSRQSDRFLYTLKNPGPPFHLEPDWGKDFSAEDRSKHSRMLAQYSFESWGMRVKYFDLEGNVLVYEPTQDDNDRRSARLWLVQQTERVVSLSAYTAIAWLFLPLVAIGLSLTSLWERSR